MSSESKTGKDLEVSGSPETRNDILNETILSKNAVVLMEVPYSDYVRLVKLIDRDEELRQRSREKNKTSTTKTQRKQLINKIQYKIISATKIPSSMG